MWLKFSLMYNIDQDSGQTELSDEQVGLMRTLSRSIDPLQRQKSITRPLPEEPDNESIYNEINEEMVYSLAGREPAR